MSAISTPSSPSDLWQFAITTYEQHGIAALCLRLQDEHACDVNLLLCCLWYGRYFGEIEDSVLKDALAWSGPWQKRLVSPLREARRWLKPLENSVSNDSSIAALRAQIKACELTGERLQLEKLEAILKSGKSATNRGAETAANRTQIRTAISANLTRLAEHLGADSTGSDDANALPQLLESLVDCFCKNEPGA